MARHWSLDDVSRLMVVSIQNTCIWLTIKPGTYTLVHIIDQGKSSKEELLNKPTCMKQILQKANHFVGVSLASKVKVLEKK